MLNRQTKPNVNLSFQDRYIMAFESELMAFNSHLILETTGVVDGEKIKNTFKKRFFNGLKVKSTKGTLGTLEMGALVGIDGLHEMNLEGCRDG